MRRSDVEEWLAGRRPERPAALDERIGRALSAWPDRELEAAPTMAETMARLGLAVLSSVATRRDGSPSVALDLLAADAFVTYAFEAAAEDGMSVRSLVEELLAGAERAG